MTRVAVLGAAGTTGALVVAHARTRALDVVPLGRGAFDDLAGTFASVNADVVINCAGPFVHTRRAVEDAVAVPLVHICGEPTQMRELFARGHASELRVPVVGGAGFSPALAELAAWLVLKGAAAPTALHVVHAALAAVPSEGSLRSYLSDTDAAFDAIADTGALRVVDLPPPIGPRAVRTIPAAESVTLPRSTGVAAVTTSVAVGPPRVAAISAAVAPLAYTRDRVALERLLAKRRQSGTRGPSPEERAAMQFALLVAVRSPDRASTVEVTGADPYGLTAVLAVQTAIDLIAQPRARGAYSALQVLDPQPALAALACHGVRWRISSSASISA